MKTARSTRSGWSDEDGAVHPLGVVRGEDRRHGASGGMAHCRHSLDFQGVQHVDRLPRPECDAVAPAVAAIAQAEAVVIDADDPMLLPKAIGQPLLPICDAPPGTVQ